MTLSLPPVHRRQPPDASGFAVGDPLSALIVLLLLSSARHAPHSPVASGLEPAVARTAPTQDGVHLHVGRGRVVLVQQGVEHVVSLEGTALERALHQAEEDLGTRWMQLTVHARDDLGQGELVNVLDACAAAGWDASITLE
jgi:hypothetical protein